MVSRFNKTSRDRAKSDSLPVKSLLGFYLGKPRKYIHSPQRNGEVITTKPADPQKLKDYKESKGDK